MRLLGCGVSARRRARYTDDDKYFAAVARMIRGMGRRVETADMEQFQALLAMRKLLDEVIADAAVNQRVNRGCSWTDIGEAAGITRQAAWQKWGRRRRKPVAVATPVRQAEPIVAPERKAA